MTTETTQAITEAELAQALADLGVRTGNRDCFFPALAENILGQVRRNREPGYEPGVLVVDDVGDVYRRCNEMARDMPWLGFGGHLHAEDSPVRPLRRLVAEGSTAMLLATKLNAIRDLCDGSELLSARQALAIIDGEGTCPGGC